MAMTIVEAGRTIVGGVDTHLDVHVAAALDPIGGVLGVESFDATPRGYKALLEWMGAFGTVLQVGVEGTGAYGAGLGRFLAKAGVEVIEVDRPNRQTRRTKGKSDSADAVAPSARPSPVTAQWRPFGRCSWPSDRPVPPGPAPWPRCVS